MLQRLSRALTVLAVLVALVVVAAGCGGSGSSKASPARVAGEYVKSLAASSHVTIVGDKVWSVRKLASGVTVVVVRVHYRYYILAGFGIFEGPTADGRTTLYVREIQSNYQVVQ